MFCPKCGNNCGDNRFCGHCGTQISLEKTQEHQKPVWSVGMACPHCGGAKLEGKNCAFCGAQLIADMPNGAEEENDSYEIPYGEYRYVFSNDWMLLTKDAVVLHIDTYSKNHNDPRIPFDQLLEVVYERSEKNFMKLFSPFSYLRFYWKANGSPVFPAKEDASINSYALSFTTGDDGARFFHVFTLLKVLAPSSVKFTMKTPDPDSLGIVDLMKMVDWDECFQRFNPYRHRAMKALYREYGLSERQARVMVDTAFEPRQMELYNTNASLAIRDANRIIHEWRQELEKNKQDRAERRARRNRY